MQYLCLIYMNENENNARPPAEVEEEFKEYFAFGAAARQAGVLVAGDALESVSTARTVRVRGQQPMITDGPFAETKEQLGGYYLLDCKSFEEALEWAAKIPTARHGSIEVRPVMVFSEG